MVRGELVAVLVTVAVPVRFPADVGANSIPKEVDCPAASETGSATVVCENPVPDIAMLETATLELPVLVTVTDCVELVPVIRLPKFIEVGEAESCKMEATLVPERGTTSGEDGELLDSERLA